MISLPWVRARTSFFHRICLMKSVICIHPRECRYMGIVAHLWPWCHGSHCSLLSSLFYLMELGEMPSENTEGILVFQLPGHPQCQRAVWQCWTLIIFWSGAKAWKAVWFHPEASLPDGELLSVICHGRFSVSVTKNISCVTQRGTVNLEFKVKSL